LKKLSRINGLSKTA